MLTAVTTAAVLATVPAVQEWRPAPGQWHLTGHTRVVADPAFRGEARTLAHDLHVRVARRARDGDIVLARAARRTPQGYSLRVGRRLRIGAGDRAGAFYGGRTVLQLADDGPIPFGRARDWPRYRERALMIDDGRAFFSRAWLAARIREIGRLKLNELHLHFSDDQGFRIASTSHPEVTTQPALTHADVTSLLAVARRNHVRLVPEIDMPGHMTAALRHHPELELVNAAGQRQAGKLDISKPAAQRFALDLVDEFSTLFRPRTWHLGGDEYLGIASTPADYALYPQLKGGKDAVIDFLNGLAAHLRARGIAARVWSDGLGDGQAARLDPRVSVEWWDDAPSHSPTPGELVAAGHDVLNTGWWPLYYVTGGPLMSHRAPVDQMYEDWSANQFDGEFSPRFASPTTTEHTLDSPKQLGASLAVWNDDPAAPGATEAAVAAGIRDRLRVLAQKTWGSPQLTDSYVAFAKIQP